jgi:transcriptional regulator
MRSRLLDADTRCGRPRSPWIRQTPEDPVEFRKKSHATSSSAAFPLDELEENGYRHLAALEEERPIVGEERPTPLVQGTLYMLILKTLDLEPMHGYGIGVRLAQISQGVFQVNAGSLFPALRRLERDGLIRGEWHATENNRRAKFYALTPSGRAMLRRETRAWEVQAAAIGRILKASLGEP